MSGYEKYVEQVADEIQRVVYGTVLPEMSGERENCTEAALAALAVVGPLIEEDTRDRMVTAAGRALEREGCGEQLADQLQDAADRWRAQAKLWDTGTTEQRGTALQVADAWEHVAELRCWARHLNRADILLDAPGATP